MRQLTTCTIAALAFLAVAKSEGQTGMTPRVDLSITLDESGLTYIAAVPASALPPLADVEVGSDYPSLGTRKGEVESYFAKICPVTIDGVGVRPILTSLEFSGMSVAASNVNLYPSQWVDACMTLVYGIKGKPRQVSMMWTLFGDFIAGDRGDLVVPFSAFGERTSVTFTPDCPEYVWDRDARASRKESTPVLSVVPEKTNSLPVASIAAGVLFFPLLWAGMTGRMSPTIACMAVGILLVVAVGGKNVCRMKIDRFWLSGTRIPEEIQAKEIFAALHGNVYRAFDYQTEDDIYEVLAQSVAGELLDDIYRDIYKGLILRDDGGSISKVDKVEILRSDLQEVVPGTAGKNSQFKILCDWRVCGSVEHSGHAHRRVNEYSAIYTLGLFGKKWKISGIEICEQKRIIGGSG